MHLSASSVFSKSDKICLGPTASATMVCFGILLKSMMLCVCSWSGFANVYFRHQIWVASRKTLRAMVRLATERSFKMVAQGAEWLWCLFSQTWSLAANPPGRPTGRRDTLWTADVFKVKSNALQGTGTHTSLDRLSKKKIKSEKGGEKQSR